MRKISLLLLLLLACSAIAQSRNLVQVQLEVVADSSNHLTAHLQVEPNTNGRDLMERIFKMEYMDFTKRFVVGIAGFKAPPKEKKFWKLEVEGVASQVGIAEVLITRDTRLRWSVSSY